MCGTTRRAPHGNERKWDEREQPDTREKWSHHEQEAMARVAPVQCQPAYGEDAVHDRRSCGDVAEWEDRNCQGECEAEPRIEPACDAGRDDQERDELWRPEREERRAECCGDDA